MTKYDLLYATAFAAALCAGGCMSADDSDGGGDGGFDGAGDGGDGGADDGGGGGGGTPGEGPGVGQGGAQDFGQFRRILEQGGIPGPETIDSVGFFNEHKILFGAPDCGDDVCLHGEFGVMGNMIDGSNCTLLLLGMNTPIDPDEIERPALNLSLAIDTSGSMAGAPIQYVKEGLTRMADALAPEDRVTLVTFSDAATVAVEAVAGDSPELQQAIDAISAGGQTNIYDGLRSAYEAVDRNALVAKQNRVILLSDGEATTGLISDPRLIKMSEAYGYAGYGLSTIGVGGDFNPELMRGLAETGSGAFYFLENPAAVEEVFEQEVTALLLPLAQEVQISVDIEPGYSLRGMYGTKRFELGGEGASIDIPLLQIAHRESVSDNAGGRRGGGGAIVAELVGTDGGVPPGGVGSLTMSYRVPHTEQWVEQSVEITSPLAPGETPQDGHFTTDSAAKAFVMLNLYVGFEMAAERATAGDDASALSVLLALRPAVMGWISQEPDDDLADDLRYVDLFIDNLYARGAADPPPQQNPPNPWPQD